jgi:putative membrane protein
LFVLKKLFIGIVVFVLIAACFTGCGNNAKTNTTLNITEAKYLTLITDIYKNSTDYTGRTIKIEGLFMADNHGSHSHYYVYRNAPFYDPDHGHTYIQKIGFEFTYKGNMPKDNDWIEVIDVPHTYNENGQTLLTLDADSAIISSKRGAETIGGTETVHDHGDGEDEHFN